MPDWGGFRIGVESSEPNTPPLVIVKVPPASWSGVSRPSRAVVVNGEIVVRPMMYVALSYDHRIIDGQQAVLFLVRIKELMEDPGLMAVD